MRVLTIVTALIAATQAGLAQRGGGGVGQNPPLASLKTVAAPVPTGLGQYVQDQAALVVLGKVLFWDMQSGSDGNTACATCHFHAGADHRLQNQLAGPDAVMNHELASQDFPFHLLSNPGNNRSAVVSDKQQVAGSMGVVTKDFVAVQPGNPFDISNSVAFASPFMPNGIHVRQVTVRNSPPIPRPLNCVTPN